MKNKQKAWRLGAMITGNGRTNKPHCTVLGAAFREEPGLQRRVQTKLERKRGPRLQRTWAWA